MHQAVLNNLQKIPSHHLPQALFKGLLYIEMLIVLVFYFDKLLITIAMTFPSLNLNSN